MFNLDPGKLLILAVVAVILLGPERLPQVARQAGAAWKTFNEFRHRMESEVRSQIPDLPSSAEIAGLVRSPTALLNKLSTMGEGETTANGVAGSVTNAETTIADGAPIETTPLPQDTSSSNGTGTGTGTGPSGYTTTPSPSPSPSPSDAGAAYGDPGLN